MTPAGRRSTLALCFAAALGCSGKGPASPPAHDERATAEGAGDASARPAPAAAAAARTPGQSPSGLDPSATPRLVVVIVLDQLAAWVLDEYVGLLPPDGVLRRGIERGALHRVAYPYAGTLTAPGHATLFTGATPAEHGVIANELYDRMKRAVVPCASDPAYPVIGAPGASGSPALLRLPTVGDALREQTGGRAHVVSVSGKDRAAIVSGGRAAELVAWYDKAARGFTTSTYYTTGHAPELPRWLATWQAANPTSARFAEWKPLDAALYARELGPDDSPGEGDWDGFGVKFPHDPRAAKDPYSVFRATPESTEQLLALAEAAAKVADLGSDDVPDLLAVSVSGTDYVGHVFGPSSWEYVDDLLRVDRAVGGFVDRLAARTPTTVLVTADHGVAPLPEQERSTSGRGGRLPEAAIAATLERELSRAFGRGKWVDAVLSPHVYLSDAARAKGRRARAVDVARRALAALPGVHAVFDVDALLARGPTPDSPASEKDLETLAARSVSAPAGADLFVVPEPYWVPDGIVDGAGTTHGTPWAYDREVPVILWGAGVPHRHPGAEPPGDARQVAPTIAALLGVAPPSGARGRMLDGVGRPGPGTLRAATPAR